MKFWKSIWTSFKSTVRGFDSPQQLALGIAFGMIIGLIPKDSLIPYAIGIVALMTTANLLCIAFAAVAFNWISPNLDVVFHSLGAWVLTFDPLEATWAMLFQLPIVPWTRFENSVVMGSVCAGLLLAIPVYLISLYCFEKYGSPVYQFFINTRIARWFIGDSTPHLQKS